MNARFVLVLLQLEDNDMVQVVIIKGNNDDVSPLAARLAVHLCASLYSLLQVFSSGVNLKYLHSKAKDPATRSQVRLRAGLWPQIYNFMCEKE
jgi:hypothetical protein